MASHAASSSPSLRNILAGSRPATQTLPGPESRTPDISREIRGDPKGRRGTLRRVR
jgi:hypothetical protein